MIDILQTSDGDVELTDDLVWTEPTEQHKRDLLRASQGDFKESPAVGVDCVAYLHDTDPADFLRTVRKQCEKDGMRVDEITYNSNGELIIDAAYENDNG